MVEEVCPWGSVLMFQKTCPHPSHKLTHTVHMYTHTEKLSGGMDRYNIFKEFSGLVDTRNSIVNFKIKHLHGTDGKDFLMVFLNYLTGSMIHDCHLEINIIPWHHFQLQNLFKVPKSNEVEPKYSNGQITKIFWFQNRISFYSPV